jgi:hypothetical protein
MSRPLPRSDVGHAGTIPGQPARGGANRSPAVPWSGVSGWAQSGRMQVHRFGLLRDSRGLPYCAVGRGCGTEPPFVATEQMSAPGGTLASVTTNVPRDGHNTNLSSVSSLVKMLNGRTGLDHGTQRLKIAVLLD